MYVNFNKTIKIKYKEGVDPITILPNGDWIDLRCAEDTTLKSGEFKYIPLGVAMQLPEGFEAIVVPRSSTFAKYGILQTNSIGVIDNSYCGNNDWWHFPALAMRDTFIPKNARICQFRLLPNQMNIIMQKVNNLSNNDRGGLGSTGTN